MARAREEEVQKMAQQMKEAEAREVELRRQMKELEERTSARDDIIERIMAQLSKHNASNSVTL